MKFVLAAFLLISGALYGQNPAVAPQPKEKKEKARIALLARAYGDSIVLRFAPSNYQTWMRCNQGGIKIERVRIMDNGKLGDRKIQILTPTPLKPLSEPILKSKIKPESMTGVFYGCLYPKNISNVAPNSIADIISQSSTDEMRHGLAMFAADQSPQVAVMAGLRYTDKDVRKGDSYLYRVYPAFKSDYSVDTGLAYIAPDELKPLPKVPDFKGEFKDRVVELSWEIKYLREIYSSYYTEISEDGKNWKRTDKRPIAIMKQRGQEDQDRQYKIDSIPVNNKLFSFRIRGVNAFGDVGPPSDTIMGTGIERGMSVFPVIKVATPLEDGSMLLKWSFPDSANSKFKYFELLRSDFKSKNDYVVLQKTLPITSRDYIDPKPLRVQYYVLRAYDHQNRVGTSYPIMANLIDSIPPVAPKGMTGKVDSSGIVRLTWKKNKEDDVLGYRLFRGNGLKEEFASITGHVYYDTAFTDTINVYTLTSKVYYRIVAVDQNYNHSDYAPILELQRPDLIPPSAPVINNATSGKDGITLSWTPSSSKDVVLHVLYRRKTGESKWITISVIDTSKKEFKYLDKEVKPGSDYEYILLAVDQSKLESAPMAPFFIHHFDAGSTSKIEKLKVIQNGSTAELNWKFEGKAIKYEIYRGENDASPRFYKYSFEPFFTDNKLIPNTKYKYYVRPVLEGGKYGPLSEEVQIEY